MTLPLTAVALVLAVTIIPAHVNESTDPVDNLGGLLSVVMISALVLGTNFAAVPNLGGSVRSPRLPSPAPPPS